MRTGFPAIAIVVAAYMMAGAQRPSSAAPPAPIGAVPSARSFYFPR